MLSVLLYCYYHFFCYFHWSWNDISIFSKSCSSRYTLTRHFVFFLQDATIARLYALLNKKNGIPVDEQRLIFSGKEIRITDESNKQTRLSTYGIEKGSTLFLVLRLHGGSGKVLDDDVELSDAPDMITWDDDPENKRAKMPCGHAISKLFED